ncbi:unnamed protein product [Schistocephalus solidus]|uniref:Uncharacterized protein n=1 Tax=Schistocephalus solidus TaxID=70667 RepID=A0A183SJI3_SCHSO|nr:unnamed protein product [Schistocephalus solidus]
MNSALMERINLLRDLFKGTGSSGRTKRSSHPLKRADSGRSALDPGSRFTRSISPFIETDVARGRSPMQGGVDGSGSANTSPGAPPRRRHHHRIFGDVDNSAANSDSFGSPLLMSDTPIDSAGTSSAATLTSMDSIQPPKPVPTVAHTVSTNGGFQEGDASSAPDVEFSSLSDTGVHFPSSHVRFLRFLCVKKSSSISNLPTAHPREWHQRSLSTGQNAYISDNVDVHPSTLEAPTFHLINGQRRKSLYKNRARCQFHISEYDDEFYDRNTYYSEYSDEEEEDGRSRMRGFPLDYANDHHSHIVLQLLKLLFNDLPPPDPKFVQGLCHNPPYICFPTPANDALFLPALACPPDGNRSRISSIVRSGIRHIFSPARRKNSHLPATKSRISTVSLPGGVFTNNNKKSIKHCSTDNNLLQYHRWSTVQPPNLAKLALLQKSDSTSCHSSPPKNTPLSSSQPEFIVPAHPPHSGLDQADKQASETPPVAARGGTVEIGLLKHDITALEKAIRKIESQLKELENWFFEQMAAGSSALDHPSSTTGSPSSEVSIKQTYKKRNSELKRQLAEMQTRLSDTRYVVHELETRGLPEGVDAKAFIRRLLADRRKNERAGVGEVGRVSGSPKKSGKSRHASPPVTSTLPQPEHGLSYSFKNSSLPAFFWHDPFSFHAQFSPHSPLRRNNGKLVYKQGGPRLMAELTTLFQEMWRQGQVRRISKTRQSSISTNGRGIGNSVIITEASRPDFKYATVVQLYKRKGNRQLCDNHRGISLLNIAGKIFARILLNRRNGHLGLGLLPESQCGLRRHCGTTDMIFAARQRQEKCQEMRTHI